MARKKFEASQIIGHLRTIEVFLGKGKSTGEACREVGITEQRITGGARSMAGCR